MYMSIDFQIAQVKDSHLYELVLQSLCRKPLTSLNGHSNDWIVFLLLCGKGKAREGKGRGTRQRLIGRLERWATGSGDRTVFVLPEGNKEGEADKEPLITSTHPAMRCTVWDETAKYELESKLKRRGKGKQQEMQSAAVRESHAHLSIYRSQPECSTFQHFPYSFVSSVKKGHSNMNSSKTDEETEIFSCKITVWTNS